jgi:hypothetical protein
MMMQAASTSETSVNFYQNTQRNNPEDGYSRRKEFRSSETCYGKSDDYFAV